MSKFKKKAKAKQEIPTSALPDIIFMLLFFFMVTTVMRDKTPLVEQDIPRATQLRKLEKKTGIGYIYIGRPSNANKNVDARIQIDDAYADPKEIVQWVEQKRADMPEAERGTFFVSMKVDDEAKMGLVTDVQEELKEANALKVMYSTVQDTENDPDAE